MKFSVGVFFCLYMFVFHVSAQSLTNKDAIQKDYIEFGKGGGFAGTVKGYIITKDGNLYSIQNGLDENSPLNFIKAVHKSAVRKIFTYSKKHRLNQITYNDPGNTYVFIRLSINHTKHSIVWNNSSSALPQTVTELSTRLNNIL